MASLAQRLGPREMTTILTSTHLFPETEGELDRFVRQRFIFYPVFGQGVAHGYTAPVEAFITKRDGWRLFVKRFRLYRIQVLAADMRPVDWLSGARKMWLLSMPGSDLGNSGDCDQRTVWGRIEFPNLSG